jgi:glycosyltransferase involved in cell wall biosynthesis
MRVLYLNNYYYIRGGSERVFFGEMELMKRNGHKVAGFARSHPADQPSDYGYLFPPNIVTAETRLSWDAIRATKEIFYSRSARFGVEQVLSKFKPNIAHVHNIYGRLSTSILDVLSERNVPTVMTLHDYKLVCPSYLFLHQGHICEDCKGGRFHMAVRNCCHKQSCVASAIVAIESFINDILDNYRKNIRLFISPSFFLRNKLIEYGWPADQIKYVPNFLDLSKFEPKFIPGNFFLYLGRLSKEKGLATLICSFLELKNSKAHMVIAGDGPIRVNLEKLVGSDTRIHFTGHLSSDALRDLTRNALSVVIPSEYYENAPISVIEALAYGKPVIGAAIGGIPEMVKDGVNGFLFQSGDKKTLTQILYRVLNLTSAQIADMGVAGREKVEQEYSSESHYHQLMRVYHDVLKEN